MKTRKSRALSILVVVCMLFSMLPTVVFAAPPTLIYQVVWHDDYAVSFLTDGVAAEAPNGYDLLIYRRR